MNTIYLSRKDESVSKIIEATFPDYRGNDIRAVISEKVRFHGTNWDEGNKRTYRILKMSTLECLEISEIPYAGPIDNFYVYDHIIPNDFLVVVFCDSRGRSYIEIISPVANITPVLAAPIDITEDERTVLAATRSYKSSYANIKDYRFYEANRCTGITRERYDIAKQTLITKKLLNRAGAITADGKNAIGNFRI